MNEIQNNSSLAPQFAQVREARDSLVREPIPDLAFQTQRAESAEAEVRRLKQENDELAEQAYQDRSKAQRLTEKNEKLSALIMEQEAEYRKEKRAARAEADKYRKATDQQARRAEATEAELKLAREGLREYGHHKQGCNQLKSPGLGRSPEFSGQECDCGLAVLLSANPPQGDAEGSSPTDGGGA